MKKPSTLSIAKAKIIEFFRNTANGAFRPDDLKQILAANKSSWCVAPSTSTKRFAEYLIQERVLEQAVLNFPYRHFLRYIKPECLNIDLAASLLSGAYLSHFSAVHVHDLSEQLPRTVYINIEQGMKGPSSELAQRRIDLAFSRPWRISNNVARFRDATFYLLNGKYTGNLGVIPARSSSGQIISVTDIERTLIDITVRPVYAGGVFEVLKAYKAALPRLELNRLINYLKQLDYTYPYHQAVGFFLERAGFSSERTRGLKEMGLEFDFYLTHEIKKKEYSKEWKLYYPSGF